MDVRCEKCGTEYELDETRLKPGGVTVKCTSCGHMFKIRKRATTNLGVPAIPPAAGDRSGRPSASPGSSGGGGVPAGRPHTESSGPVGGERNWIIKMANGEQRTCRELGTLQQWIVQGLVRRDSMISRSGKTWKQLGDIPELAQFFGVAEEAGRQKRDSARITGPHQPQRPGTSKPPETGGAANVEKATLLGMPTVESPRPRQKTQPPPPPKALAAHAGPMAPLPQSPLASLGGAAPANDTRPKTTPPPPAPKPAPPAPAPVSTPPQTFSRPGASNPPVRTTGAWANENVKPLEESAPGQPDSFTGAVRGAKDEGGFVGQVKAVPTHDAAFVGAPRPARLSGAPQTTRGFTGQALEDLAPRPIVDDDTGPVIARDQGGGLGKWIAIGSLVLMAGAAAAIYFMVIRQPDKADDPAEQPMVIAGDAGVAAAIDAGTTQPDRPVDDPLASARDALMTDSGPALAAAAKALAELPQQDAPVQALRARLITAQAQTMIDEAAFRNAKAASKLEKDAKKAVADAMVLAQKAVKTKPDEVMAQVAMADVLRLQGKPAKEVRAYLGRAKGDREALFVEAMLAQREKQPAEAKKLLNELVDGSDVRPSIRLALLAYAGNDAPAAQSAAEDVIARQADHVVASLLLAKLQDTVATGDPMPPEEPIDAGVKTSGSGDGSGTSKGTGTGTGSGKSPTGDKEPTGDYDELLAKADHLAEVDCAKAMPYYAKALELKPNGVAALTGRGYCYIDSKQFSSAHSSFRAALAVSRKYEPALWGIAEAYQQQGLKDKAIEAYQSYLEVYPGSSKAEKQLEKLGVASGGGGGEEPKPDPPPDPQPDPPPPEEPAPSE